MVSALVFSNCPFPSWVKAQPWTIACSTRALKNAVLTFLHRQQSHRQWFVGRFAFNGVTVCLKFKAFLKALVFDWGFVDLSSTNTCDEFQFAASTSPSLAARESPFCWAFFLRVHQDYRAVKAGWRLQGGKTCLISSASALFIFTMVVRHVERGFIPVIGGYWLSWQALGWSDPIVSIFRRTGKITATRCWLIHLSSSAVVSVRVFSYWL